MAGTALIDIDGTLVDTNYQNAIAWSRAFRKYGLTVPVWRLHRHLGMGGDQLVPAVATAEVERRIGDALRDEWRRQFAEFLPEVVPLAGSRELLERLRDEGWSTVLASSGAADVTDHYLDLLGARELVEGWTTSADVEETKPAPDLIEVAWKKAGGGDAVVLGDSPWDVEAATRTGLPTVCVLSGGFAEQELRDAGAVAVFATLDAVGGGLTEALAASAS